MTVCQRFLGRNWFTTRNQITNTGLSFWRLRTHCTIAPLIKKKQQLSQLPRSRQLRVPSVWRCSQWHVINCPQVALVHNQLVFNSFSNGNILCSGYPKKNSPLSGVRVVHDWAILGLWLGWSRRLKEKGQGASVILVVSCRWKQPIYCLVIGFPVEDVGFTISMSEDVWRFWDHSRFCCKHLPWKSFQQLILDDFGTLIQLESSVVWSIFNFVSSALILLLAQPRLDTSVLSSFAMVKATTTLKGRRFAGYLQTLCHQERHVAGKGPERGSEAWRIMARVADSYHLGTDYTNH